ncbi:MAG: hypothetical protein KDE04_18665, partial [Anaerolineales bacterium]|nr:hypothetical protein [Anaerolineales bacterium]
MTIFRRVEWLPKSERWERLARYPSQYPLLMGLVAGLVAVIAGLLLAFGGPLIGLAVLIALLGAY